MMLDLKNYFKSIHLILFTRDVWKLQKGGKYYYSRNNSCVIGFTVGKEFEANNTCFKIIGAHTDSPSLRFAPFSKKETKGYNRVFIFI
jgi:aspartyl aminopeptidase